MESGQAQGWNSPGGKHRTLARESAFKISLVILKPETLRSGISLFASRVPKPSIIPVIQVPPQSPFNNIRPQLPPLPQSFSTSSLHHSPPTLLRIKLPFPQIPPRSSSSHSSHSFVPEIQNLFLLSSNNTHTLLKPTPQLQDKIHSTEARPFCTLPLTFISIFADPTFVHFHTQSFLRSSNLEHRSHPLRPN